MEGEGDKVIHSERGDASSVVPEQPVIEGESTVSKSVNLKLDSNLLEQRVLICNSGSSKTDALLEPQAGKVKEVTKDIISEGQRIILRDDNESELSPFSKTDSEDSEREILLEPLNASDSTPLTKSTHSSSEIMQNEVTEFLPKDKVSSARPFPSSKTTASSNDNDEADEIQSSVNVSSLYSVPEQAARLAEDVEPISVDESSSSDENRGLNSNSNFLESINSDEDSNLGADLSHKQSASDRLFASAGSANRNSGDYKDSVSDKDTNLNVDNSFTNKLLKHEFSEKTFEKPSLSTSSFSKGTETGKKQITSNFIEHQEELDYEENEGDDGNGKPAEAAVVSRQDVKEDGEHVEDGKSDKDEGELSDDDCEEGEIKEPGGRKIFVKPLCRFFQRGNCTWGVNCRFLHPGVNDKGNYQMIEIPGFMPVGVRARLGIPGIRPEQPEDEVELPPPPVLDVPPVETAWERGLRLAKEQRRKATERKERETDFEAKRMNLSVDEEWGLNKENENVSKVIPKDLQYDQQVYEENEYYKIARDPWQASHSENFQVRYNQENSFSPPNREKYPMLPSVRYSRPFSPPEDKFERDRLSLREPFRPEAPIVSHGYTPLKRSDEWTDPWRRSKSPKHSKQKVQSGSRGKRRHRSVSDYSHSSRSRSGSSGSSRSSRSGNTSSGSSSLSRSPEPAPPGVERHDRYVSPSRDQPRSTVPVRGPGGYGQGSYRSSQSKNRNQSTGYQRGSNWVSSRGRSYQNRGYGGASLGPGLGYAAKNVRNRSRDRTERKRGRSPPDRPLPYVRPRPKSASSDSNSSRSRSRSRGRVSSSRSRSSSRSSRSSSSSSSSAGSADSEHLYRDLGSPSKNPKGPAVGSNKTSGHKEDPAVKAEPVPVQPGSQKHQASFPHPPFTLDQIPQPSDPKPPQPPLPSGKPESKYASRNAPLPPVKAKDPLKIVGQKSNIKLTLLPKQQSSLGGRPNPLDSPPLKRQLSNRDTSPVSAPPAKLLNLMSHASTLRLATEKAAQLLFRQDKGESSPSSSRPQPVSSSSSSSSLSSVPQARAAVSPQKPQSNSVKSRPIEPSVAKTAPKASLASAPIATTTGAKAKKSMSSRREELLKQLKAVEDAIARKKSKF